MIQIVIEMHESGQGLTIKAMVPPPVALAVVTSAYHELLSQKFRMDYDTSIRVARALPPNGGH